MSSPGPGSRAAFWDAGPCPAQTNLSNPWLNNTLDERINKDIHRMCKYRVALLNFVAFKQQTITLGSPMQ